MFVGTGACRANGGLCRRQAPVVAVGAGDSWRVEKGGERWRQLDLVRSGETQALSRGMSSFGRPIPEMHDTSDYIRLIRHVLIVLDRI